MHIHWQGRNIARKAPNNFRRPRDVAQGRTTRRWPGPTPSPLGLVSEIPRILGSAMGIAIANRKNRCDFGALRLEGQCSWALVPKMPVLECRALECKRKLESVSTGVWCVPGFAVGFEIALKPSKPEKEGEIQEKGTFIFCAQLWYAPQTDVRVTLVQKRSVF